MSIDSRYRRLYGLTESEYDAQCEFQQDRCAVCGEQNPLRSDGSRLRLAVDHDHVSNECRELLCDRCNKILGFVRDSRKLLLKLAEYLKRHGRDDFVLPEAKESGDPKKHPSHPPILRPPNLPDVAQSEFAL
jgi:hypothetical protein